MSTPDGRWRRAARLVGGIAVLALLGSAIAVSSLRSSSPSAPQARETALTRGQAEEVRVEQPRKSVKPRRGNRPRRSAGQGPSHSFNFSQWNLTLPVDASGGTGGAGGSQAPARIVSSQSLMGGFRDPYFRMNKTGGLVFTAPSNGATTTPGQGSNHARSELHENYVGPGAGPDGTWTSTLGGELHGEAVVNAVSVDSQEATIAQIHGNGSAAFALLEFRTAPDRIVFDVYREPDAGETHETVLLPHASLGEQINFDMSFKEGVLTVTANGVTKVVHCGRWEHFPVRFDIGAYSAAPNTGNPAGDVTRVTYLGFGISH